MLFTGDRAAPDRARASADRLHVDQVYVGSAEHFRAFAAFVAQTGLKPVVDQVFPFTDVRRAYDTLEAATHFGKLVVQVA